MADIDTSMYNTGGNNNNSMLQAMQMKQITNNLQQQKKNKMAAGPATTPGSAQQGSPAANNTGTATPDYGQGPNWSSLGAGQPYGTPTADSSGSGSTGP